MRRQSVKDRFMEKVLVTKDCWLWQATKNGDGYGRFKLGGRLQGAHRVAYFLYKGEIPSGMCVLHRCDTPACVRPDHLFLGTQRENIHDMEKKQRSVHPHHTKPKKKVTREMYQSLREWRSQGETQATIANRLEISQTYVSRLLRHGYGDR